MANPTPITTKKNVPVTLWPDAPDPRTQPGYGAAGMGNALRDTREIGPGMVGGRLRRFKPWGDPWGVTDEGGGRGPAGPV